MVILAVTERSMTLAKGVAGIGGFRGGFLGKGKIELKHGGGYKGHAIVWRCWWKESGHVEEQVQSKAHSSDQQVCLGRVARARSCIKW